MDILIRRAEPGDYVAIQQIYTMPEAQAGTLQTPFPSEKLWRERLENVSANTTVLVAVAEGKVIGQATLEVQANMRRRHAGWIGMAVHDHWHRKGVGSQLLEALVELADNWYGLLRLELIVFCENEAALGLYKKFGFVEEGVLKAYAMQHGAYKDVLTMARIM